MTGFAASGRTRVQCQRVQLLASAAAHENSGRNYVYRYEIRQDRAKKGVIPNRGFCKTELGPMRAGFSALFQKVGTPPPRCQNAPRLVCVKELLACEC